MEKHTFGFLGAGNMGSAIASAVCKSFDPQDVLVRNSTDESSRAAAERIGCRFGECREIAESCRFIFLGVKPQKLPELLSDIENTLAYRLDEFVLVSMAAGVSSEKICKMLGKQYPVIRIMPNTPLAVGQGMTVYSANSAVSDDELEVFLNAMSTTGKLARIDEGLIDAASALSGCGPAFVCLFAEALADGAVECGLPRAVASELAAQTLAGTAELIKTSGKHPGRLKDEVCSPGGSTIAGVHALEDAGFRAAAMNAVTAAFRRTKQLGE